MDEIEIEVLNDLIDDLNRSLTTVVRVAGLNFILIERILNTQGAPLEDETGVIIEHLQRFDLLQQKLEHIKNVNSLIQKDTRSGKPVNSPSDPLIYSLFRLNHLQFEIACADLNKSIEETLNILLLQMKSCISARIQYKLQHYRFFLAKKVMEINSKFTKALELCSNLSALDVISKEKIQTQSYTSEAERLVLDEYLRDPLVKYTNIVKSMRDLSVGVAAVDLFLNDISPSVA